MAKIMIIATVDQHIRHFHLPLIKALVQKGHKVYIASNGQEVFENVTKKYDLPFQRNPFHLDNMIAYRKLRKIFGNENFDVIHVNTPVGSVIGRLAAKKLRKSGLKVIYTAHGFHFFKGASKKNWLLFYPIERYLMKYTDALITMNDEDFNRAKSMAAKNSKLVIKKVNGVGVNLEREKLNAYEKEKLINQYNLKNSKIITCVAEISRRKNQEELIEAFSKFKDGDELNTKLLLIGGGKLIDELKYKVNDLGLSDNVIFTGYQTNIDAFLEITDVLVSASKQEGLPVNIIEAMSHGLPIVASEIRGHVDLLEEYPNGELYELRDINMLSNAIVRALSKDRLDFDLTKYSVGSVIDKTLNIYSLFL
ncbi:glycosyltransferase family 4 protein [Enterococcus asini]|uniref:glycosyltransferase family 4 protein n=1 Tax=Enterococcus asini TaxID=57732 RepID=UPI002891BBA2|nr:glycosyltransferase family 4 protein [Enterococcus asini]MDT2757484.1 glycosyltransferase family 4 protein [Enterococcus asini]